MHVQLKPRLRRVWRDPGSVEIGLTAERGLQLDGLAPCDVPFLDRLRTGVDTRQLAGGPARRRELVRLLADANALVALGEEALPASPEAEIWSVVHPGSGDGRRLLAERARRHVVVRGEGTLVEHLRGALLAAGVGRVTLPAPKPPPPPEGEEPAPAPPPVDLVVLIDHAAADAARADRLVSLDVPHLSVVIREQDVVIGPLVRPGAGPCLRCLDLHRGDRDPSWPAVLAQLLGGPPESRLLATEPASAVLSAGLAALQVLGALDGFAPPATAGATLEVELPDGLVARREWPAHPGCGCTWPLQAGHHLTTRDGGARAPDAQMHVRGGRMTR